MRYSLWIAARVGAILPRHIEKAAEIEHPTREAAERAAVRVRKNPNVAEVGIDGLPDAQTWEADLRVLPHSADADCRVIDSKTGAVIALVDPDQVMPEGEALEVAKAIARRVKVRP